MTKRIYNHVADVADERDLVFQMSTKKLPPSTDLRPKMPPVYDQGQLGSCTANGIVALREYYMIASGQPVTHLSRLYLYYKERELEGTIDQDAGAMIRDGMKTLSKTGCALEVDFPYDISTFTHKPSDKAETDAAGFKIASYHRILTLKSLKSAIASGQPVVFGFMVYDSFESQSVADTGIVPMMPLQGDSLLGGHCVVAVGYDDATQLVKVRNSWGASWGDHGYCYMPYELFDTFVVTDMWVGKYNAPKTLTDVSFQSAIDHYVSVGTFNSPEYWLEAPARFAKGQITKQDADNFMLAIQKAAARDMTLGDL